LAQAVVDSNAIPFIAPLLSSPDAKLRRQVLSALSQIAKHTVDLAETVVDADLFPNLLICLKADDVYVSRNAATLISEISKHTPDVDILTNSSSHNL
jgi:HEAT repeat protein